MRLEDYAQICYAVNKGEEKFIENLKTHYTGKVLGCGVDHVEVEIAGHIENWPLDDCEETMGSKYHHKERTLDTHPWDIDRFNPYI